MKPVSHLNAAVQKENWATPTTDTAERAENYQQGGTPLTKKVQQENWSTPEAQNHDGYQVSNNKKIPRLGEQAKMTTKEGKLNPAWVEQLMGYPVGTTQMEMEWMLTPTEMID